jgi:hypothetical protein
MVVINSFICWNLASCSPLEVNKCFGGSFPVACVMQVSSLVCSSTMDIMIYSSETSVDFQRTTWSYNAEEKYS